MRFPRSLLIDLSWTRSVLGGVLLTMGTLAGASATSAQEISAPRVVALDRSSANLLRTCFPTMEFEVLIQVDSEQFDSLNARAWMNRDAGFLVFRSDRLSITSRLFRERLMSQGVQTVDLSAYASADRDLRMRPENANPDFWQPSRKQLLATALNFDPIHRADQASPDFRP